MIGGEKDFPGIIDNGACGVDFTIIEIQQGPVQINAADADDAEVNPKLFDKIDGHRADDTPVPVSYQPAGDDHLKIFISAQNRGNIEVVCNHLEAFMAHQGFGDLFGGGADVDEKRRMVGDVIGNHAGDFLFFFQTQNFTFRIRHIFRTCGHPGTAMIAPEHALFTEGVDIAPDGLRRYLKRLRQGFNGHKTFGLNQL